MPNTTSPARRYFVEEDLGDGYAEVQREDFENSFDDVFTAADGAAELWAQNDNGFLSFPCYRVASVERNGNKNYGVSADPIDCRP